ncbi:MAG: helix-turn-helix transcriptional regulator [Clostridia bacterium]|nr:helix-turn-helix transcriptional regulator [Clostridia bacterium]
MNIGSKIKTARNEAGLTQENAAELLGVSRQTVSNWENEKSYPDIVSVIRMSDIYNVSLDRLLKEDSSMTDGKSYIDYLEDSTNLVKSKNKLSKIILLSVYLFIWALSEIVFWFFTQPSDAMGYSLMFIWIIMPVTTFIVSMIIGKNGFFGKVKWILPIVFGIMFMLVPYSTLTFSNMEAFHTFRWPDFPMMPIGAAISFAGTALGMLISRKMKPKKDKE